MSGLKTEIVQYIEKRLRDGADGVTITKELREKWPHEISDDSVAQTSIQFVKQQAPPSKIFEIACPQCAGMPHLRGSCTTCGGEGSIWVTNVPRPKK